MERMSKMEILDFNNEEVKEELVRHIKSGVLVPIIGSGFTGNEELKNGKKVPNGRMFKELMINEIVKIDNSLSEKELKNEKFSEISSIFWELVGKEVRKDILKNNFIGVKLSPLKEKFLNIDWPYIYTLNIDDAIERYGEYSKLLPYKRFEKSQTSQMKRVYKMHGDANEEIFYDNNKESIIFNENHYIKSLEENQEMLAEFISDYKENNIIYIGCSLDDEIDLQYAVSKCGDLSEIHTNRYFVTNEEINIKSKIKLRKYGINKILKVNDYNEFYKTMTKITIDNEIFGEQQLLEFINPDIEVMKFDFEENLRHLLNGIDIYKDNRFIIPQYFIERDKTKDIIKIVEKNDLVVLVGRRISGKTFILADLVKKMKAKRDVYFFPSTVLVSEEIILKLLKIKNSLIIFDTNSIDFSNIVFVKKQMEIFKRNNTKIVITANTNDNLMFIFAPMVKKFKIEEIKINNVLSQQEYDDINKKLSKIGISEFLEYKPINTRKNYKLTILDNIVRLSNDIYGTEIQSFVRLNTNLSRDISPEELKILVMLATGDKIYRPMLQRIGIDDEKLSYIKKKYSPIIDVEGSAMIEKRYHTNEKIVCNSRIWLLYMLGKYSDLPNSAERIGEVISEIVECLINYKDYKSLIKNMILFDNLNQIFVKENRGAIKVIFEVYSSLQDTELYEDRNYWLQRSKSILSLKRTEKDELEKALKYALKAYNDADKDDRYSKIKENSSLTIAMIYGRIFTVSKLNDVECFNNCINWYYTAICKYNENAYIKDFVKKSKLYRNRQGSDFENILNVIINKRLPIYNENKYKANELYKNRSDLESAIAVELDE